MRNTSCTAAPGNATIAEQRLLELLFADERKRDEILAILSPTITKTCSLPDLSRGYRSHANGRTRRL
jgi:hypothetical protein